MKPEKRIDNTGFRVLLVLGAVVSIAFAIFGLVWTDMLVSVLGVRVPARAAGLARLYGGAMLAIGIGYGLAAAQPQRNRSLLVPLFVVPLTAAVASLAALARSELPAGRGAVFIIYNLAYCFLYFRLYPKVSTEPVVPTQARPPPGSAPPPSQPS